MYRADGKYYLTNMSLCCKGVDFSCKWIALMYAIIAAAMAVLMASGVGAVLVAAIVGAAVGAGVGASICGTMAAIMRMWLIIKKDLIIVEYQAVSNKSTLELSCAIFAGQIKFMPNVTNWFGEYFIFAANTVGVGLEGFMYVYGFRGAGLLKNASQTFLCNFASNYLKSWATTGILFRAGFSAMAGGKAYFESSEKGGNSDEVLSAVGKTFFFEAAVAEGIYDAATSDEENPLLKTLGIAKSVAPIFAMGGIPGGPKGETDATKADVTKAAEESVPGKIAKKINEWKAASKEHQAKLEGQGRGQGAGENSDILDIKQGPKEKLGDFGERIIRKLLENDGFDEFFQVQNKSGNGVDIVARNSKTGAVKVIEVKASKQEATWNNRSSKELPLSEDQSRGGEYYADSRLGRAANKEDGWKNTPKATEQAELAQEAIREADEVGKVSYEKYDVYVDEDGALRDDPVQRTWDPR